MISRRKILTGIGASTTAAYIGPLPSEAGLITEGAKYLSRFAATIGANVVSNRINEWIKSQNTDNKGTIKDSNDKIMNNTNYTNIYNSPVYASDTSNKKDNSTITYPILSEHSAANLVAPIYRYNCSCNRFDLATPIYGPSIAGLSLFSQYLIRDCGCSNDYVRALLSPIGFGFRNSNELSYEPESQFETDFDGEENIHVFKTKLGQVSIQYKNREASTYGGTGSIRVAAEKDGSVIKDRFYDIIYNHRA